MDSSAGGQVGGWWMFAMPMLVKQGRASLEEVFGYTNLNGLLILLILLISARGVLVCCNWWAPGGPRGLPIIDVIASQPETAREILTCSSFANHPLKQSAQQLHFGRNNGFVPSRDYWWGMRRIVANHLFAPKRIVALPEPRDIAQGFREKYYPLLHHAIPRSTTFQGVPRVRWVHPKVKILILMIKAAEEVSQQNLEAALEILREAIELHPDGFSLLVRALVNHLLGQKEGVKRDLQEAERLFSIFEHAEGTGEHFASSVAYSFISDILEVPTSTTEKLYGKQMIVKWSVAVTENQRLNAEVQFTPSIMLRPDGNVEVIVIVDSLRFEVVRSQTTDSYLDHFLQSLRIVVRPTGKWSESFSEGFGLITCSPGNEINPLLVQQGRSRGFVAGIILSANPSAVLQLNGNITSGTSFSAYGFNKSARKGHAYVCEYELRTFEDRSSAQNLRRRRFYTIPKIPETVRGEVNYPNLYKEASFAGTWLVPEAIAMELRNELEFTISLEAKLPAVRKCRMSSVTQAFKPPKHELEVRKVETRRTCVFAIARLKSFIGKST